MNDDLYLNVIDDLPNDFNLEQFMIMFIRHFPDQEKSRLLDFSCDRIKKYLRSHILGKTIQRRLRLAKRMTHYPSGNIYWTKDLLKKQFEFRISKNQVIERLIVTDNP